MSPTKLDKESLSPTSGPVQPRSQRKRKSNFNYAHFDKVGRSLNTILEPESPQKDSSHSKEDLQPKGGPPGLLKKRSHLQMADTGDNLVRTQSQQVVKKPKQVKQVPLFKEKKEDPKKI